MKRFTETEKWRDPWFRSLPAPAKLIFFYLVDNCNNAGFHELDEDLMVILTGMKKEHVEGALKALQRGIKGPCDGWYWVRRFLRHQKNDELNPANPAHKQIIGLIRDQSERFENEPEFQEFYGPLKGLLSPIGKGIGTGKGISTKERSVRKTKFEPPELEEWLTRADALQYPRPNAEQAYHSYAAKGWMVGNSPMTAWRSAIQTCFTRWKQEPHGSNGAGLIRSMSAFEIERRIEAINQKLNQLYKADKDGNRAEMNKLKATKAALMEKMTT